ncbi:FtsX-like permease family protein, partial [Bacillus sp. D-CC]
SNVQYGKGQVERLFDTVKTGRNIGIVLIAGLLFTAMFLISNTIKITIYARSTEIEIMKLVGATNWFIRWPFLLEGLYVTRIKPIGIIDPNTPRNNPSNKNGQRINQFVSNVQYGKGQVERLFDTVKTGRNIGIV